MGRSRQGRGLPRTPWQPRRCWPEPRANANALAPGTSEGADVWTLWIEAFDDLRAYIREFIEADDAVVCDVHWQGRGKTSGLDIDADQFDVFEFGDGKLVRVTLGYKSKAQALEAARLR